jgi:hypothetical protein
LDLSRTNQPGSTIAGSVVDKSSLAGTTTKKNQIASPAFTF